MDTVRLEEIELFLTGGFNGATTLRSWILFKMTHYATTNQAFQWGHNLAVMDTKPMGNVKAGIEMFQWGHNLAVMDTV